MRPQQLIEQLQLEPHPEGGYFRRTYTSSQQLEQQQRPCLSSIFYLLTTDSPTGHLHRNRSDILHFWQAGAALRYTLITPEGDIRHVTLGSDLERGQQLQLLVPGGYWKGSQLISGSGDFGLISEAVCPGFDFADHEMASWDTLLSEYPELASPNNYKTLDTLIANHD